MSSMFNPTFHRYILLGSNNYQPDQSTFTQHLKKKKHLHQYNNEETGQRLTPYEGQIQSYLPSTVLGSSQPTNLISLTVLFVIRDPVSFYWLINIRELCLASWRISLLHTFIIPLYHWYGRGSREAYWVSPFIFIYNLYPYIFKHCYHPFHHTFFKRETVHYLDSWVCIRLQN